MSEHTTTVPAEPPVDHAFRCANCDHRWYYTRARCSECGHGKSSTFELGTAEVVATTTVEVTPEDVRSPNPLALVSFGDVQLTAQLVDQSISVGDAVEFADQYWLRDGDESTKPRLTAVEE